MDVPNTSDHIRIKIKMPNPIQEAPASYKAPNQDLKDMNVLCTIKIKIESQNLDHGSIKYQWPYPNQGKDAKPQSGTSMILQGPIWELKGHGCFLHLQNQDREPNFWSLVYERLITISKSWSRFQTPVSTLQNSPRPQSTLKGHRCSLHLQNQDREPRLKS